MTGQSQSTFREISAVRPKVFGKGVENIPTGPRHSGGMERAMKIGQTPELTAAAAQSNASKQAKAAAPAAQEGTKTAASSAGAGVAVTLSRNARDVEQSSRTASDFDADRVKAVRSAIESGTFKVDAGAIADKMLANAEEIISHSRG